MPPETSSGTSNPPSGSQDPYKMVDPNGLKRTSQVTVTSLVETDSPTDTSEGSAQT